MAHLLIQELTCILVNKSRQKFWLSRVSDTQYSGCLLKSEVH